MQTAAITTDAKSGAKTEVRVHSEYMPHIRLPQARYCFAYHIVVRNIGATPLQLISREWKITDGNGETREVRGAGVVGEQPHIPPNADFAYTSYADLPTPAGSMTGFYTMRLPNGDEFAATIPTFSLVVPRRLH